MERTVLVLDSSQISAHLMCPMFHKLQYIDNLTPSNEVREDFAMGTYGHKMLEILYKNKGTSPESFQEAVRLANAFDPDQETCECGHDTEDHICVVELGHICNKCACGGFSAQPFPLAAETREKVKSRFQDYWMKEWGMPLSPVIGQSGLPLVEQGFSYPLLDNDEFLFVLEGKIDLIATRNAQMLFVDHKWQGREHELYQKSIQFRNYNLATGLSHALINYIRLHANVTPKTLVQQPIFFSAFETAWWKEELIKIFKKIALSMQNPERNWDSCSGKFGRQCMYTKICEEPNVVTQEAIKSSAFKLKKEWKPW